MAEGLSALEQAKATVNPYDGQAVFARLARGTVADITPEDDIIMRWHGLYRHRPLEQERFMLRLKMPGGAITAGQLTTVADLVAGIGGERISLTTRQDIEIHGLSLADLPGVFAELAAVGLTTVGACGDQVRNVVTCPAAGLNPAETVDTSEVAQALTRAFLANPAFANLPRKLKVAISGCADGCVPVDINDVGLVAARNAAGALGYALLVGGGLSAVPVAATDLHVWVAPERVVEVVSAIAGIFRDYGSRENRGRARLKHLLAARGVEWFREELTARLGEPLPPLAEEVSRARGADHLGVHRQQEGRVYLGIPVPAGRLTLAQARHLAALSQQAGQGQLRITHFQNVLLPDIPAAEVGSAVASLAESGLPVSAESWRGSLVSCTGKEFCAKAAVHTRGVAAELVAALERAQLPASLIVRMSGCPNGCSQHAIADIGLQGALAQGEERFDLWVGGGDGQTFGRRIHARLHPGALAGMIGELQARRAREGLAGESFSAFARRVLWAEANQ